MPQIKDSLYEQLNPLTTVAGQHFVEDFSGDTLDTFRWGVGYQNGSDNDFGATMADSVDGGVLLTTGSDSGGRGIYISTGVTGTNASPSITYTFSNYPPFRVFEPTGSTIIFTMKVNKAWADLSNAGGGFTQQPSADGAWNGFVGAVLKSTNTYWRFNTTNDSGSGTTVTTGVSNDTNYHNFKIDQLASSGAMTIDGVLEATNTGTLPTAKQTVVLEIMGASGTGVGTANVRYCEAWNH